MSQKEETLLEAFDRLHVELDDEDGYPTVQTARAAFVAAKAAFHSIEEDMNLSEAAAVRSAILTGDLILGLTLPLRPETPEAINAFRSIIDTLFFLLFDV